MADQDKREEDAPVWVLAVSCTGNQRCSEAVWSAVLKEVSLLRDTSPNASVILLVPRGWAGERPVPTGTTVEVSHFDRLEPGSLAEVCQRLISLESSGTESLEVRCAKAIGRGVTRLDPDTGEVVDRSDDFAVGESWLGPLLKVGGVNLESGMAGIYQAMENLAERSAPVTRSRLVRMALLQTVAVALPLTWFLVAAIGFPAMGAAFLAAVGVGLLLGSSWWLRWRSMHLTWARARLVAEVARSFLAVGNSPVRSSLITALRTVPALQPILWRALVFEKQQEPAPDWVDSYLRERIDDQDAYFESKQVQALKRRRQITRWATVCMDLSLALAAVGLVVALSPRPEFIAWAFGGNYLWAALGLGGGAYRCGIVVSSEHTGHAGNRPKDGEIRPATRDAGLDERTSFGRRPRIGRDLGKGHRAKPLG